MRQQKRWRSGAQVAQEVAQKVAHKTRQVVDFSAGGAPVAENLARVRVQARVARAHVRTCTYMRHLRHRVHPCGFAQVAQRVAHTGMRHWAGERRARAGDFLLSFIR